MNQEAELKKELERLKKSPLDTLLLEAAAKGELERMKHLLALNANLNAKNELGQSVLLLSMLSGSREVIDYLMAQNPDMRAADAKGNNLIDNMAIAANIEMLTLLIDKYPKEGGIVFLMQTYNKTRDLKSDEHVLVRKLLSDAMLKTAVKQGNLQEVDKAFREFRVDVDAQDSYHETALHKAAYLSHLNIVEFLLDVGARTDIKDRNNQTAIQAASGENKEAIIRLIKHCELLRCVQRGDKENLERLMTEYADLGLNHCCHSENKNLLVAAIRMTRSVDQSKRIEIIKLLLNNGANTNLVVSDVTQQPFSGNDTTPLHIAVSLDDRDAIKLLVKAGALRGNKNDQHQTVVEYARAIKKPELADYMLEQFAKEKVKKKHGIGASFTTFGKASAPSQEAGAKTEETPKITASITQ